MLLWQRIYIRIKLGLKQRDWGRSHSHIRGENVTALLPVDPELGWRVKVAQKEHPEPCQWRAGSPGGTQHGAEVLVFTLVSLGTLSPGWCWTAPLRMRANPLCAQLILERFSQCFSNNSLNFSGLVNGTGEGVASFLTLVDLSLAS